MKQLEIYTPTIVQKIECEYIPKIQEDILIPELKTLNNMSYPGNYFLR